MSEEQARMCSVLLCVQCHQVSEVPEPRGCPPNCDSSSCVTVQVAILEEQGRPLGLGRG